MPMHNAQMLKRCLRGWLLALGLAMGCAPVWSARLALVIGNDAYRAVSPLRNAGADAAAVARTLEASGFRVELVRDASAQAMRAALERFAGTVEPGDEAVVFYAGHGVQIAANNYLLPVDIRGQTEEQVRQAALSVQTVLDALRRRRAGFALLVIDACRDNPFGAGLPSAAARGLVPTAVDTGQMIIYSAGSGQQALDSLGADDRDPNGLFTRVFVRELSRQEQSVDRVLRRVRDEVARLARGVGHEQVPALYDQSLGDFFFRAARAPAGASQAAAPALLGIEFVQGAGDPLVMGLVADVLSADLLRSGRFRLLSAGSGTNAVAARNLAVDAAAVARHSVQMSQQVLADGRIEVQIRVYELPARRYVGGRAHTAAPADLRTLAHSAADWIHEAITSVPGQFRQRRAKITTNAGRQMLMISDSDGANEQEALRSPRAIALPTWSQSRQHLAYVSFETGVPQVWVQELVSGRRQQIAHAAAALVACSGELAAVQAPGTSAQEYWLRDDWAGSATPACAQALKGVAG